MDATSVNEFFILTRSQNELHIKDLLLFSDMITGFVYEKRAEAEIFSGQVFSSLPIYSYDNSQTVSEEEYAEIKTMITDVCEVWDLVDVQLNMYLDYFVSTFDFFENTCQTSESAESNAPSLPSGPIGLHKAYLRKILVQAMSIFSTLYIGGLSAHQQFEKSLRSRGICLYF